MVPLSLVTTDLSRQRLKVEHNDIARLRREFANFGREGDAVCDDAR